MQILSDGVEQNPFFVNNMFKDLDAYYRAHNGVVGSM